VRDDLPADRELDRERLDVERKVRQIEIGAEDALDRLSEAHLGRLLVTPRLAGEVDLLLPRVAVGRRVADDGLGGGVSKRGLANSRSRLELRTSHQCPAFFSRMQVVAIFSSSTALSFFDCGSFHSTNTSMRASNVWSRSEMFPIWMTRTETKTTRFVSEEVANGELNDEGLEADRPDDVSHGGGPR